MAATNLNETNSLLTTMQNLSKTFHTTNLIETNSQIDSFYFNGLAKNIKLPNSISEINYFEKDLFKRFSLK